MSEFTVAQNVSQERLWQLLMDVANYGATKKGGVNRQALSVEDTAAKQHVIRWASDQGFSCFQDDIGNLFVRREGIESNINPVMAGSHLDSQPKGGKFDGAYGVLSGLEALAALDDAQLNTKRPIEIVAWTNEEGSRYSPGAMGSSVFAGLSETSEYLGITDVDGILLGDDLATSLAETGVPHRAQNSVMPHAYIEPHIEQGPVLEAHALQIGVVEGIQGIRFMDVVVTGEEAHAGTTPRRARKDALSSAVAIITALQELTSDEDDTTRFTVGRCITNPGSPNTVPGRVQFTIDLRHPDKQVLHNLGDRIREVAEENVGACSVAVSDNLLVDPTIFDPEIKDAIRDNAQRLGLKSMDMPSGAGHDAMHLAKVCPVGMIFVPCLRGVSHNEAESATPEDLAAGAKVLAETLYRLANS